jgi:hypothetical protein
MFSPAGFDPSRDGAPYTAISRYAKGSMFLISTPLKSGWAYRIDYPYYSWAETILRPRIKRRELSRLLVQLNQLETEGEGVWKFDHSEMTSAIKFLGNEGMLAASRLAPDEVATVLSAELLPTQSTVAGAQTSA